MAVGIGRILARFFAGSPSALLQRAVLSGTVIDNIGVVGVLQSPTYGVGVDINLASGTIATIVVTNNVAFTINAPTNPVTGMEWILAIRNTSGVAMGVITFNAVFKLPAFVNPATGFQRSLHFYFDGTNHREVIRGTDEAN